MSKPKAYDRSNHFVASFQIEGLCLALRELVLREMEPGQAAKELLTSLRDEFVKSGSGKTVEHIPQITGSSSASDLLVIAEVLRSTMLAFLTPEEAEEQRGIFGFHGSSNGNSK